MTPVRVWLAAVYLHISIQTVEKLCRTRLPDVLKVDPQTVRMTFITMNM